MTEQAKTTTQIYLYRCPNCETVMALSQNHGPSVLRECSSYLCRGIERHFDGVTIGFLNMLFAKIPENSGTPVAPNG